MATKYTGWYCDVSTSVDNSYSNTQSKVTVTAVWVFNGWRYDINYIKAWVSCGNSEELVMDNGFVSGRTKWHSKFRILYFLC